MRQINLVVIHCSATRPNQDIGAYDIDIWHKNRGFAKIGYHYVITRDGQTQRGRHVSEVGAHVKGHNAKSIGICLVGGINDAGKAENNFTDKQFDALKELLVSLRQQFAFSILGHRDLSPDLDKDGVVEKHEWMKECPSFDVRTWLHSELPEFVV